jgi:hypothetical protein
MAPLTLRADVGTVNEEERSVEVTWTTGAAVERFDWMSGQRYLEVLSLETDHIRLDRLNAGGPLLDAHSGYSVTHMLGVVVPGSVTLTKKEGRARVRFSRRAEVEGVWQDVRDGIVRSLSVGYRVYRYEETEGKGNKLPIRKATDWEPHELSMVPIPADAGAKVRAGDKSLVHPCEIVCAATREEKPVERATPSEFIAEQPQITPPPAPAPPAVPTEADQAREAERVRVQGILTACRVAKLPQSFADGLISSGRSLLECQSEVFSELAKRNAQGDGPSNIPSRIEVTGDDPLVHERAGIEEAFLHRMHPEQEVITTEQTPEGRVVTRKKVGFPLTDRGRRYRGMRALDVARVYLTAAGVRVTSLSPMELAGSAMGLTLRTGGMHTTTDFANLLADLPGKVLRQAYMEAPQTFAPLTRRTSLADFKPSRLLQLGEAPALLKVLQHGEFTSGTIGESKEQYQLETYGRKFAITRQALVNDDLDAFARVPLAFGRQARNLESDLVWTQIVSNPTMGDGVALFHATHGNLAGSGGAIDVTTLGAGRAAMRNQKGIDAATYLNVNPLFLIVAPDKETIADQFVNPIQPQQAGNVNPFAGRLSVIAEPRLAGLSGGSTTAWYLASSPNDIDIIVLGTLDGENGPMVESRVGFDVDGLEIKVRHDVAAKVVDHRGLYKNAGA